MHHFLFVCLHVSAAEIKAKIQKQVELCVHLRDSVRAPALGGCGGSVLFHSSCAGGTRLPGFWGSAAAPFKALHHPDTEHPRRHNQLNARAHTPKQYHKDQRAHARTSAHTPSMRNLKIIIYTRHKHSLENPFTLACTRLLSGHTPAT